MFEDIKLTVTFHVFISWNLLLEFDLILGVPNRGLPSRDITKILHYMARVMISWGIPVWAYGTFFQVSKLSSFVCLCVAGEPLKFDPEFKGPIQNR